jgi:hypothetical protein
VDVRGSALGRSNRVSRIKKSILGVAPTHPPIQWLLVELSLWVKQPPSCPEVKNVCAAMPLNPSVCFHGVDRYAFSFNL